MIYRIIVRDNDGSIINEYRDSAENEQEMYKKAAEEWHIDERGGWIDVQAE